jgi:hypothetical protein
VDIIPFLTQLPVAAPLPPTAPFHTQHTQWGP